MNNINISNLSEDIKIANEINCSHIKHLFESTIFSEDVKKYDNCFIKLIRINKKRIKKNYLFKTNSISSLNSIKQNNKKNKIHIANDSNQVGKKSKKSQIFIVSK